MTTALEIKEGIEQGFLECAVCLDSYKNPRCLPCMHACCSECLEGWMRGKIKFQCPICKAETKVPDNRVLGFPVAFHVNALQDFIQKCEPAKPVTPCRIKKEPVKHDDATVHIQKCKPAKTVTFSDIKKERVTHGIATVKVIHSPITLIEGIVILEQFVVAWQMQKGKPTEFFVSGHDVEGAKILKRKLEQKCPHAYRMVKSNTSGNEVLVVSELTKSYIKILSVKDDKMKIIVLKETVMTVAVDKLYNIFFTDFSKAYNIKKWAKNDAKSIFVNKDGKKVLSRPWYIAVNINDDVIVSDCVKQSLIIFSSTGVVRKIYDNFSAGESNPRGICVDRDGNIYVCDYYGHCIHQLDKDGVFLKRVITKNDGLFCPRAVLHDRGVLVVGQEGGNIKYFKKE